MQYTKENLIKMIKYQEKHGKRHGEPFTTWVLQKRSINIAFTVIFSVEKMDFEEFELALFFTSFPAQLINSLLYLMFLYLLILIGVTLICLATCAEVAP